MRISRLGRIGLLLVFAGFGIDFAAWLGAERSWAETFRWGPCSALLFPIGMLLFVISIIAPQRRTSKALSKSQTTELQPGATFAVSPLSFFAMSLLVSGVVLYSGSYYWMTTRIFTPLDRPVSLSRGHMRTGNFLINLKGDYEVNLNVDYPFRDQPKCEPGPPNSELKTHLTIYRNGQIVSETDGPNYYFLGSFSATRTGYYSLDLAVLSDTGCLDTRDPHITVATTWPTYDSCATSYTIIRWLVSAFLMVGLSVLLRSLLGQSAAELPQTSAFAIVRGPGSGCHTRRWRLPPNRVVLSTSSFALLFCALLAPISSFVISFDTIFHLPPQGFWVLIPRHEAGEHAPISLEGKVVFRIDSQNHWYLGAKQISPEELPHDLIEVLARRPDWVVYFEADPSIDYKDAVSAMALIRSMHAKIVLVTPHMRSSPQ